MSEAPLVERNPQKLPSETGWRAFAHRFAADRFPLKPETEAEFIELLQRRLEDGKSVSVEVSGGMSTRAGADTITVGTIGSFEYSLVCFATVDGHEKIQFERSLFDRYGSQRGVSDADERDFFMRG